MEQRDVDLGRLMEYLDTGEDGVAPQGRASFGLAWLNGVARIRIGDFVIGLHVDGHYSIDGLGE